MLSVMGPSRLAVTAAAVAVAFAALGSVSACSSVTTGSGSGGPSGAGATSSSGTGPSSTAATTPATSSPPTTAATSLATSATPTTSGPPPSPVTPAPKNPLRTVTVTTTISGKSYVIKVWAEQSDPTCVEHAYGTPVINYLKAHPCGGLHRLLATTTVDGRAVGFAESRLGFVGSGDAVYDVASKFIQLVNKEGTGNIRDLLRDGRRLPSGPTAVPSPNAFSALGQDAGVIIDEIWYLHGPTPDNDPPLVQLARDIFLQFG